MKTLILTNGLEHFRFVLDIANKFGTVGEDFMVSWYDNADWELIKSSEYDVGISFMYQHKVPAVHVNTHTWFNFHPAPLPEYKGRNLCYHAIMNGEKEFGATLHYMDENFDTGDIIEVRKIPLLPSYTADTVSALAIACSKKLFVDYLPRILAGEEFERKPNVGGAYYQKESINDFIDMNYETVETFDRKVRAITYGDFYPKIEIGGVIYKVVRE